ncbi:MAG: hypothetical protein ABFD10_14620 [Prolixibacteraceae bacterium]
MSEETVEVTINNRLVKWYRSKGYDIPTREVQLYYFKDGKRYKNGKEKRIARGTKILVARKDLMPCSNEIIYFKCETCGKPFTTTWQAHRKKISNNCKSCQAKKGFKGGCHSYWVNVLITNNPDARCDISGETDKRFLVLHHLYSKDNKTELSKDAYVILSANYHMAFHVWNGGTNVSCTPEKYLEFKQQELGQTDLLAEDWEIV